MLFEVNMMLRFGWIFCHLKVIILFLMIITLNKIFERLSDYIWLSIQLSIKFNQPFFLWKESLSITFLILLSFQVTQLTFWKISCSSYFGLIEKPWRWCFSWTDNRVIFLKINTCWHHWTWFLQSYFLLYERFHRLCRHHFGLLALSDKRMFLAKFIFYKFLILIFLLFRCCPSWTFCLAVMMVRIVNELSFSFDSFESKISSFLTRYRFKEVIFVLFFGLFTCRWFITFRLFKIWSTDMIKILIT